MKLVESIILIMESVEVNCDSESNKLFIGRPNFDDEFISTATSIAQEKVEKNVKAVLLNHLDELPNLRKSLHIEYLLGSLKNLPSSYEVMDSSRTWTVYWVLHSLALLQYDVDPNLKLAIINFLKSCQHVEGGFGGGPFQEPHLAPTYAAVNALCILGTEDAYNVIDRRGLLNFLRRMKVGDGSFYMHEDGEIDLRSVYCCIAVYSVVNLRDKELFANSLDWVSRCQTYEGGFAGSPGMEAHGGYTFCGVASLYLLGKLEKCDLKSLRRWILNRQTAFEGGFQGRTNKLVDSCYSFWQYGSLEVLNYASNVQGCSYKQNCAHNRLIDNDLLQEYLLICCQHISGGFIDKPTTSHDPYHTCYSLSGLSLAQQYCLTEEKHSGDLADIHPVFNLPMNLYHKADLYFKET
ncbi:hypothetical protein O3M35_004499 [Rhynocoris fuscipes]|uniref:Protein farnesyltransferase subunit beta n=1 Tax=Rhynocoris fuscipes TaxID=488301 RepID=A0AAW1CHU6_9HEMI